MKTNPRKPLGIINLESGPKEIYPTNDFFLNYLFNNPKRWEALRTIVNIYVSDYKLKDAPHTLLKTIDGEYTVTTQYKYYLGATQTSKSQDLKIEDRNITFVEVQNRANTNPPIELRAIEYFGLSLGHNRGRDVTQIWILAEDVDSVLHGSAYANYVLKNEVTDAVYPVTTNLMFVSLRKLAANNNEAGELSKFLLGRDSSPKSNAVQSVVKLFDEGFNSFIEDKEAKINMSVLESYLLEGRERGREEGMETKALEVIAEMFRDGFTIEQIAKYVKLPLGKIEAHISAIENV